MIPSIIVRPSSRMLKKSASFVKTLGAHCLARVRRREALFRASEPQRLVVRPWEKSLSRQARGGRVKCIRFALRNCRLTASPASANVSRHWALTVSRPFTNLTCIILHVVNLIILRVADLAAAEPRSGVSRHAGVGRVRRRAILNILRGSVSSCATFKQAISSRRKIVFQQPSRSFSDRQPASCSQNF